MVQPIRVAYDTSIELLECVRLGLEEAGLEAPCRVCVVPGEIVWDTCANGGQLVISLNQLFYSNVFPTAIAQDSTVLSNCGAGMVVADFTLSLMRCAPGTKGIPPRPPTCEELQTSALQINEDNFVMRTALMCCLTDMRRDPTSTVVEYRISNATVVGPEGGCVGNTTQLYVAFVSA